MSEQQIGGDRVIGVDVGGTFTDLVSVDSEGIVRTAKVPSTPSDQSQGVLAGLDQLASKLGKPTAEMLAECDSLVHGTTVATNMMLELRGSKTAIITTKGFRDIIDIRRNYREVDFDIRYPAPTPLVPRRRRVGVTERVSSSGEVLTALDEAELTDAVRSLLDAGVESIAVCYLFSFLNPAHELRTRELIASLAPDVHVSLSHEVLPKMREFERVSATAVDAFVTPKLAYYLERLASTLRDRGFDGEMFVMAANGGMLPVDSAAEVGAQLVLSGPAGGVVAGAHVARRHGEEGNAITVDMGGTSYDICLIEGGKPVVDSESWMNRYRIAIPTLDIKTIGAGGGSIARVDVGGRLAVGPESAGAVPGPACFGKGGELPTVTDANLVLGLLDEGSFLGGTMRLDREAAERAIREHVGDPLGIDTVSAAAGISRIVNNAMANGIREVSVSRGHDPRDFSLVVFGGAGPIHSGRQARELGVSKVVVPKRASVLCAFGDVLSDVLLTKTRGVYGRVSSVAVTELEEVIVAAAEEGLAQVGGVDSVEHVSIEVWMEMHYLGQTHDILVPALTKEVAGDGTGRVGFDQGCLEATTQRFHEIHERLFTFCKPEEEVEILGVRVDTAGHRPAVPEDLQEAGASRTPEPSASRAVYMEEVEDFVPTDVYTGDDLRAGDVLVGPAVIQESDTTLVAYPGDRVTVLPDLSYSVEVATLDVSAKLRKETADAS